MKVLRDIICRELPAFKSRSPSEHLNDAADPTNFINQGAHRLKEMLSNIGNLGRDQRRSNFDKHIDSTALAASIVAASDENLCIADDVVAEEDVSDSNAVKSTLTPTGREEKANAIT